VKEVLRDIVFAQTVSSFSRGAEFGSQAAALVILVMAPRREG